MRPESPAGKSRVLHRNLLLPCKSGEAIQEGMGAPVNVRSHEGSHNCSISRSDNEKEFLGISPTDLQRLQLPTSKAEQPTDGVQLDYLEGESMVEEGPEAPFKAERTTKRNNLSQDNKPEQNLLTHQEPDYGSRPVRNRLAPKVLCYDQPGNPTYHPLNGSSIQVPLMNAITNQRMHHPSYCPYGIPVLYHPSPSPTSVSSLFTTPPPPLANVYYSVPPLVL